MKESSVVHAYRSPLSPPSLPPSTPTGFARCPSLCGQGRRCRRRQRRRRLQQPCWRFFARLAPRAMFCSDNPISHGRTRSPLHSALSSVFAAPRSGFVRNCMRRRRGHASWASQRETSRRGLGGTAHSLKMEGNTGPCGQPMSILWLRNSPD